MKTKAAVAWQSCQLLTIDAAAVDEPGVGKVLGEIKATCVRHASFHGMHRGTSVRTEVMI